jgi:hypothetical protein
VVSSSTDDDGEYYAMAMAQVLPAEQLPADTIIVVPLTTPRVDEALDFAFMAAAECMFVKIHETPQARRPLRSLFCRLRLQTPSYWRCVQVFNFGNVCGSETSVGRIGDRLTRFGCGHRHGDQRGQATVHPPAGGGGRANG